MDSFRNLVGLSFDLAFVRIAVSRCCAVALESVPVSVSVADAKSL